MTIRTIGVIGAGTMGQGVSQTCAASGLDVIVNDVSEERARAGVAAIGKVLDRLVSKEKISAADRESVLSRIRTAGSLDPLAEADFCIEAATENPELKLELFAKLDAVCRPDTVIASNTSSISLTRIAAASGRPDRIIGMHFFNPVPLMKLVELIRAIQTSNDTFERTKALTESLGKTPVAVNDSPGFVVNRMLVPMINEAAFALSEGLASAEAIDTAMKLGANHPMGPLALADLIGLDVCLSVMEVLHAEFADSKYRPCPLLKKMVDAGYLGRKSGRGFFSYG